MKLLCSLSLLLVLFSSCNGQGKTHLSKDAISEPTIITNGQPKLVKTQGTNEFSAVRCSLQDKAGDLWFGTGGEGVYRYNGKSFINFTEKDGLSANSVCSILEDKAGNIWFGTKAGISRYDGKAVTSISLASAGNFYSFTGKTLAGSQPSVWSILQDKTGKIWFCTSDGVYIYDGNSFTHFLDNDDVMNKSHLNLRHVSSILEDKSGNIWFATWFEGLCRYDGKSITNFKPNGEVWFDAILEDRIGNIWIGRRAKGVCRYDGKTFTNVLQHGVFDSCCVSSIAEDKWGNIWFGSEFGDMNRRETMGGLWRYDPSASSQGSKAFINFTMKDGLSNMSVFSITIDRSGKLWIGTRGMGLCSYDGKTFTNFTEGS